MYCLPKFQEALTVKLVSITEPRMPTAQGSSTITTLLLSLRLSFKTKSPKKYGVNTKGILEE